MRSRIARFRLAFILALVLAFTAGSVYAIAEAYWLQQPPAVAQRDTHREAPESIHATAF